MPSCRASTWFNLRVCQTTASDSDVGPTALSSWNLPVKCTTSSLLYWGISHKEAFGVFSHMNGDSRGMSRSFRAHRTPAILTLHQTYNQPNPKPNVPKDRFNMNTASTSKSGWMKSRDILQKKNKKLACLLQGYENKKAELLRSCVWLKELTGT